MKGLLLKDIYNLSGQIKVYACYPILAAFLAYQQSSLEMIAFTSSFLSLFIIISACAYDELADFDSYALTLPLTRKDLVLSKYQLSLIAAVSNAGLSLLTGWIMLLLFKDRFIDADWQMFVLEVIVIAIVINLLLCFFLPMIFKFGTEKARVALMVVFLSIGAFIYFLISLDFSWLGVDIINMIQQYGFYILAIVAIIAEVLSIMLSNHFLYQKDL